jgi:hypothetical protein
MKFFAKVIFGAVISMFFGYFIVGYLLDPIEASLRTGKDQDAAFWIGYRMNWAGMAVYVLLFLFPFWFLRDKTTSVRNEDSSHLLPTPDSESERLEP